MEPKPRTSSDSFSDVESSASFLPPTQSVAVRQRDDEASRWPWAIHVVLALGNILAFVFFWSTPSLSDERCWAQTSSFSAIPYVEYEVVQFNGFTDASPYKGPPSAEVDQAWDALIEREEGYVSLTYNDLVDKLHKNGTYAQIGGSPDGGYLGVLEVYHQLHCVNLVRMYTYEDYYRQQDPLPPAFADSEETLRRHIDHCLDYLRELVVCAGDTNVYTAFWTKNRTRPYPDFRVQRKCRKFDKVAKYAHAAMEGIALLPKPSEGVVLYDDPFRPQHLGDRESP